MPDPSHSGSFLIPILVFLAAAVVAVPLFRALGMGAVIGYLAAGVAIGPHGLGLFGGFLRSTAHVRPRLVAGGAAPRALDIMQIEDELADALR
jgi:hypothetical protein